LACVTFDISTPTSRDTLLIQLLAIRLGEQTTLAKSLVMAKPAVCGSGCEASIPAPDASQRRVMAAILTFHLQGGRDWYGSNGQSRFIAMA